MVDVFISYASPDRSKAEKLTAFLQSKGYDVWFDKALEPAEQYRDKIMDQIDAARVVVAIWTPSSILSDWCRAEANRARVSGKLVPVRSSDLDHDRIPLPFGELHTISLSDEAEIERAIVKQIRAPRKVAPWYRWIWGGAKHEALSWFGVIGIVLTLTRGLEELMRLAGLLDWLTGSFLTLTNRFWSAVLFFVPTITRHDSVLLNLALFFFVLFITSCSRSYITPPLLSERYLRSHLAAAVAAFIIVNVFALVAQQLPDPSETGFFNNLAMFIATNLFGGASPGRLLAARALIMLVFIGVPVGVTLGLGYGFDPAKAALFLWRVVAGIAVLGLISIAHRLLMPLFG